MRRRARGCCCGGGVYLTGCNQWQSACFGSSDPNDFPSTATLSISGSFEQTTYCGCPPDGAISQRTTGSYSLSVTGAKRLDAPPSAFGGWANGGGVWYELNGVYQWQVSHLTNACEFDFDANQWGAAPCVSFAASSAGTISGRLFCGACNLPNPATPYAPCSGFSLPLYRGWAYELTGAPQLVPLQISVSEACGGDGGLVDAPYEEQISAAGQFDGCSTTQGCEFCNQVGGCLDPQNPNLGARLVGNIGGIGSYGLSVRYGVPTTCVDACGGTDASDGTASITFS